MKGMFKDADYFNRPLTGGIGEWNAKSVTNMSHMIKVAQSFNQPFGHWNTQNVVAMNNMFESATPNAHLCTRWCHEQSVLDTEWMCFHKPMATPEHVETMQLEVAELITTLDGALEEICRRQNTLLMLLLHVLLSLGIQSEPMTG